MDVPQPKKSAGREIAEKVVEGAIGAVPVAGSPLAALFGLAIGWSYNRRVQEWLDELAEAVKELQERTDGLSFEDLAEDEVFVDAVVNASRAAQATHQREKLDALRNGVLNSLAPDAPDVDTQARFFRLVDQFTAAHLRLLTFMHNPSKPFEDRGEPPPQMTGGRSHILERAMPEFGGRRDWYDLLHADLAAASLINSGGMHTTMSTGGLYTPTTTGLGDAFLAFVSGPE
jgi:hypothetical protein